MPFAIVRNDISSMKVDAIVNTANPRPVIGTGTDMRIHSRAGEELLRAREAVGPISRGRAAVTPGFRLPAKYVIHTVGPSWEGGHAGEREILESCYRNCLRLAEENGCASIAFPMISTGNYGFPKDEAFSIATGVIESFLEDVEMMVYLVVFDRKSFTLSSRLYEDVSAFIDDNYANELSSMEYALNEADERYPGRDTDARMAPVASIPGRGASLEDLLANRGMTFSECLIAMIDERGLTDPEVYKKANVSRKLFSKIKNNRNYKPGKITAVAFAIALGLDIDEATDFIGRAGFAFSDCSKFDIIVRYFIETGNYNMYELNAVLFRFDQPLIGV